MSGRKINKSILLCTITITIVLYLFKGMLYISENGWILLTKVLSLDARVEEAYAYDTCYDMIVNGEHMDMISYAYANKELYADIPSGANRFSLLTESYGIVEFCATKKDGNVESMLIDPYYIMSQEEQMLNEVDENLAVIEDFLLECWRGNGFVLIDYGHINEGRLTGLLISLLVIIFVQLVMGLLLRNDVERKETEINIIYCTGWLIQILAVIINISLYIVIV